MINTNKNNNKINKSNSNSNNDQSLKIKEKLKEFDQILGETIRFCQIIEFEIKMIISEMSIGNSQDILDSLNDPNNFSSMKTSISILKKVDNEDGKPHFSETELQTLYDICNQRNVITHSACEIFIYNIGKPDFFEKIEIAIEDLNEKRKKFNEFVIKIYERRKLIQQMYKK